MKTLKIVVVSLFIISICAHIYSQLTTHIDYTYPSITCSTKEIKASTDVSDEELLSYVTAYDEKDGDLSKNIIIESISAFINFSESQITYAVCDNDNHVAKLTVNLKYTNYKEPVFGLNDDLVYPIGANINLSDCITVSDSIDGDITEKLVVIADNIDTDKAGVYPVTLKVTNSKSYTYSKKINIIIIDNDISGYTLELSKYMIYTKKGETPDFNKYIKAVSLPYNEQNKAYNVEIDKSDFHPSKEGTYDVFFNLVVENRVVAKSRIIVMCEENNR